MDGRGQPRPSWWQWERRRGRRRCPPPARPAPAPAPSWKVEDGVLVGGQGKAAAPSPPTSSSRTSSWSWSTSSPRTARAARPSTMVGRERRERKPDKTCTFNSGIAFRTGYQLNLGRREAGEYVGVVVHREAPDAIRGNVLWLDKGEAAFRTCARSRTGTACGSGEGATSPAGVVERPKIVDINDNPTLASEAAWKEAGPITLQWPPAGESGGLRDS